MPHPVRAPDQLTVDATLRLIADLPYIVVTLGTMAVAAGAALLLSRRGLAPLRLLREILPSHLWLRRSAWVDVCLWLTTKAVTFLMDLAGLATIAATTALLVSGALGGGAALPGRIAATGPVFAALALGTFLVKEFAEFLFHVLGHKSPFLWELHKVHHSATGLIPITARRTHPLYTISLALFAGALSGLFIGLASLWIHFDILRLALAASVLNKVVTVVSLDTLRHSHFPVSFGWLDRLFISPHMHHVHHSSLTHHWDRNYGTNLSLFDWLFGTVYLPKAGEEVRPGIGEDPDGAAHGTLRGVYILPLVRMGSRIAAALGRPVPADGLVTTDASGGA